LTDNVTKLRGEPQTEAEVLEEYVVSLRHIKQVLDHASDRLAACKKIADDAQASSQRTVRMSGSAFGQHNSDKDPSS
jgi:hypothetical protein